MDPIPTPSQTVGPFFHLGCTQRGSIGSLITSQTKGEHIRLICRLLDGAGIPVPDAMIEIWQANAEGKYNHPDDWQVKSIDSDFVGFGRLATDDQGVCNFETIKPGRVSNQDGILQAGHVNVSVFARGILKRLPTRIYFENDLALLEDPVLALVPEERRHTLLAHQKAPGEWRFDIHLCGENETVFFDI